MCGGYWITRVGGDEVERPGRALTCRRWEMGGRSVGLYLGHHAYWVGERADEFGVAPSRLNETAGSGNGAVRMSRGVVDVSLSIVFCSQFWLVVEEGAILGIHFPHEKLPERDSNVLGVTRGMLCKCRTCAEPVERAEHDA